MPTTNPTSITRWGFLHSQKGNLLAGAAIMVPDGIDSLVTTNDAATLCGVSAQAIRMWANRGLLTATGLDERGRKLYKLIDVAKAERATRAKARRN